MKVSVEEYTVRKILAFMEQQYTEWVEFITIEGNSEAEWEAEAEAEDMLNEISDVLP